MRLLSLPQPCFGFNPEKEINHCIGSKTAYAMLPAAFINTGDVTLMTVPGYPVAGTATKWFGGTVSACGLQAHGIDRAAH